MQRVITTISTFAVATSLSLAQQKPAKSPHTPQHPEDNLLKQLDTNRNGSLSLEEFLAGPIGQKDPAKAKEYFNILDANSDSKVTRKEIKEHRPTDTIPGKIEKPREPNPEEVFKKLDTNGDGALSLEEFLASPIGQKDPTKAEEYFKIMDKDGDGKVTLDEFRAPRKPHEPPPEEVFKKIDTNGDGSLSLEEFLATPFGQKDPAKAEEAFKMMDKDGDGKVTLDEFRAPRKPHEPPPEEVFKKIDTNGDGALSLEEFLATPFGQKDPAKAEEAFKMMDKDGDGKVTLDEFRAPHKPHEPPPEEVFKKIDTNGDGALSLEEFLATPFGQKDPGKAEEAFKMMDKDGDGKVTLDEFRAPRKPHERPNSSQPKSDGNTTVVPVE